MTEGGIAADYPLISPGVGESYRHGWHQLWKNFLELFLGLIIMLAIIIPVSLILGLAVYPFVEDHWAQEVINHAFYLFIVGPLEFGWAYMTLRAARSEKIEISHLFQAFRRYGKSVLGYLLMTLFPSVSFITSNVVIDYSPPLGVVLTIVSIIITIIVYCKLVFTPFLLLDKNLKAFDAIRASWNMTGGHAGTVFLIGLLGIPIVIAGLICFLVGIIPAGMWIYLAVASLYHAVDMRYKGLTNMPNAPLPGGSDYRSGGSDRDIYPSGTQRLY